MPFYGRVYSQIPCQPNHWTSGAIKIERRAGEQIYKDGCWPPFECGSGWCACTYGTRAHNFLEIAQGEEIFIQIDRCYAPPPVPPGVYEWYEIPLQFSDVGNNRYDLYGEDIVDGSIDYVGYIKFLPTTPPDCYSCIDSPDEACEECIDNTNLLPETNLVQVPKGTDGLDPCAEDDKNLAGFKVSSNGLLNYDFELNACYNTELQRWWFLIDGNTLNFKYVLVYCDQNITELGATLIDDYENFPPDYGCDLILRDLDTQYKYGKVPQGGYVLKSMLEAHELQHYLDFALTLQIHREELFLELLELAPLCEEINSVEEAKIYWQNILSTKIYEYWDRTTEYRDRYTNWWGYERQTHSITRRNITQIKINALCYWNCAHLLPPNVTCP